MLKNHKTYNELIQRITAKNIHMDISEAECIQFLKSVNYYRLSAYRLPFKVDRDKCSNVNFSTIMNIYNFDHKLRSLIFTTIDTIENYIRSQIAYHHAGKYGALGYLSFDNFGTSKTNYEKQNQTIAYLVDKNKRNPDIEHHTDNYNDELPLWVIIEYFSLRTLSYFYSNIKPEDKLMILSPINLRNNMLESYLRCLTDLRNRVAHHARLYYWSFSAFPLLRKKNSKYINKKLFTQLLMLKSIYPQKNDWKSKFYIPLEELMSEYEHSISLLHIGFPNNWKEILS